MMPRQASWIRNGRLIFDQAVNQIACRDAPRTHRFAGGRKSFSASSKTPNDRIVVAAGTTFLFAAGDFPAIAALAAVYVR